MLPKYIPEFALEWNLDFGLAFVYERRAPEHLDVLQFRLVLRHFSYGVTVSERSVDSRFLT